MIYIAIPLVTMGKTFSLGFSNMPFRISACVSFIKLSVVVMVNSFVLTTCFNYMKIEKNYLTNVIIKGFMKQIIFFLPMAIFVLANTRVQHSLSSIVFGGMLISTILIVLPVLYKIMESKKSTLKMSKATAFTGIFIFFAMFITPANTSAQQQTITLQQAIDMAIKNYPSVKAARLNIEKQKTMKGTAFDFGSTSVFTGKDEVGNGSLGTNSIVGIQQDELDLFSIPSKNKLIESQKNKAQAGLNLTEAMVRKKVKMAFYSTLYYKKQWLLLKKIDTVYANFEKAAMLRYKTQQTSKIEYLSASAKYKELQLNIKQAKGMYDASLKVLNQYLMLHNSFEIDDNISQKSLFTKQDTIGSSPLLDLYLSDIEVAKSQWNTQKATFLPKISGSYTVQSINNQSGYHAWQAGISVPLLFFAQSAQTKAAKIDYRIAEERFLQKQLEVNASYNELLSKYLALKDILDYYKNEALPLAKEQISASNLAYSLGSIDYIQFIQNTEAALNTGMNYYKQEFEFFVLEAKLQYLTGE